MTDSSAKKIAIVTGGASGIGLACAERLAADGMKVVIADMNEKAGTEHAKRLAGDFVFSDLIQRKGCRNLVDETLKKHATVHVLVNNAGYQQRGARYSARAGAISTMRPRYITATRSLMCSTTDRSWAMNR